MTTLTGFVASVVVHSSAAAFAHFGMTLEPIAIDPPAQVPAAERVVARSRPATAEKVSCPDRRAHPRVDKA
jgi:hypothetical protein